MSLRWLHILANDMHGRHVCKLPVYSERLSRACGGRPPFPGRRVASPPLITELSCLTNTLSPLLPHTSRRIIPRYCPANRSTRRMQSENGKRFLMQTSKQNAMKFGIRSLNLQLRIVHSFLITLKKISTSI